MWFQWVTTKKWSLKYLDKGLHPSNTAMGGVMVKCHTPLKLNTPPDTKTTPYTALLT